MSVIAVEGLHKSYGSFKALQDVAFCIDRGEIVGFLGPNGAGKSTTMKILTGFMPATSGTAKVAGYDVFEAPMEVKRRIGYLPEAPPVYPDLTVHEYLEFVGKLKRLSGKSLKESMERAIERVNLTEVTDRLIGNLSKGFQQRTGLAQALLGNPEVLILDEPTVGLDPRQIEDVRRLIKDLAGEHTVILSTHILQEATAVCERVVIINQGRIVADDKVSNLLEAHQRENQAASLESVFLSLTEV